MKFFATMMIGAAFLAAALHTTPALELRADLANEMAGMPRIPSSQQEVQSRFDDALFGDFDRMMAGIN